MGKQEITVKTSTGEEFKFGGISENFTRKLYEWEERRNIAPESSTIALLNSNLSQSPNTGSKDQNSNIEGESLNSKIKFQFYSKNWLLEAEHTGALM